MKFQNPNLFFFQTHAHTHTHKAICPFNFFKVGGIKKNSVLTTDGSKPADLGFEKASVESVQMILKFVICNI